MLDGGEFVWVAGLFVSIQTEHSKKIINLPHFLVDLPQDQIRELLIF